MVLTDDCWNNIKAAQELFGIGSSVEGGPGAASHDSSINLLSYLAQRALFSLM